MSGALFTVLILCIAIVSYAVGKFPLVITALCSTLVLYFSGIISFEQAFSVFSNNAVIMLLGMQIIGIALSENGLVDRLARGLIHLFTKKKHFSERHFILISGILAALLSTVINPTLIVLMFMEITDSLAALPGSDITRKNCYLPLCISSTYGAMFTSISATTFIVTSGLIAESSVGRPLTVLEPLGLGLACLLVYILFYCTIGYRMEQRCFDFPDIPAEIKHPADMKKADDTPPWKIRLTLLILAGCIGFFIFSPFSIGAVAMAGSALLIMTGCLDIKNAFVGVKWETVVLVACCLGFAKGVETSGASLLIANAAVDLFGAFVANPIFLCALALVMGSLLSNVMNNSSAAATLIPIFISIAEHAAIPVLPVALAVGTGAMLASATPICAPVFSFATSAGYRFKDYIRVGGLLNIFAILACLLVLTVRYLF